MRPDDAGPEAAEHVHAGYKDFGLKGPVRGLCSCGHTTAPKPNTEAALQSLLREHGARLSRAGESVGVPYGS